MGGGALSWDEQKLQTHLDAMAGAVNERFGDKSPLLVGIESGGAWVAQALNARLPTALPLGSLNPAFYRDDFDTRGLKPKVTPSKLPFDVDGQHILLVDDVLMTGRTIRAAMNELFDFGRPASITLVVLFDIGRRELPIGADICGETLALPPHQRIELHGPSPLIAEIRNLVVEDDTETRS
ncbi:bifunctional pyr operon transcriptional regulator/uracil phosphoribosyltransferase PyrR [Alcanivorax sp.]|jgi:pyrimidine operon attenuation protein/uracil phosphoribosyltransferase|uniref:bifunctional pyr operon transcriptional regulator/uracil phosphoribosyltransferase PyrR n=1 Tax=Alcanivorax sp. TaxID=1872427 RepID=UPI0032D931E3